MKPFNISRFILISIAVVMSSCEDSDNKTTNSDNQAQQTAESQNTAWLEAHNQYRRAHHVDDLVWSKSIAKAAQEYADTCPNGHSDSDYGENLAYSTAKQYPASVVKRWYDEVAQYDFANPKFSSETGHFTQVVWKSTTEVGCGQVSGCQGKWADIVVCQYNTPGNYQGQFSQNVFPL